VHDKLILAEIHGGIRKTLIGSAGFTTDVIANRNAENFICTDSKKVYEDLMEHHRRAITSEDKVKITQAGGKSKFEKWQQGKLRKKFSQDWLQKYM
jgi:hypothetical protein